MSEPTPDDLQEREVLREWLHGAHADIRVVRRQVAALLRIAEGYEEHPLERPERAADGLMEVESIQYTPDRLQAVRDWLGDAYDKVRAASPRTTRSWCGSTPATGPTTATPGAGRTWPASRPASGWCATGAG